MFSYNLLNFEKDGLSDYDFVKSSNGNSLLKTSVSVKDINWVGSWVITLPERPTSVLRGDKRKFLQSVRLSRQALWL